MAGMVLAVSSRALLGSCARMGIDTEAIVAAAGIDRAVLEDPDGYLPAEQVQDLWRRAYQASGDPDLALNAAESLRFGAYRVIDFLAASAATVGSAFTQLSAYFPIINSAVRLPIDDQGDHVTFGVTRPDDPAALGRPYTEYVFAAAFLRIRAATNVTFPVERVELAFPAPASIREHERIFACPVDFCAARNALHFSRATWETANGRADPDLFGVLAEHARIREQKVPSEPVPVREVRQAIAEQLKGGAPSLERTAKQMAMSPRTLQRRLRDHGLSYADLLDRTRAGAAKSYLTDRQISVAEVAYLLGFSEQSAFTHAFKRWTGQAPNEYRKQA